MVSANPFSLRRFYEAWTDVRWACRVFFIMQGWGVYPEEYKQAKRSAKHA